MLGTQTWKWRLRGNKWRHWIVLRSKWICVCTVDGNWPCLALFDQFTWRLRLKTICWRLIFKSSLKLHSRISFSCSTKSLPNLSSTLHLEAFDSFFDEITDSIAIAAVLIALWSSLFCAKASFLDVLAGRVFVST